MATKDRFIKMQRMKLMHEKGGREMKSSREVTGEMILSISHEDHAVRTYLFVLFLWQSTLKRLPCYKTTKSPEWIARLYFQFSPTCLFV